MASGQSLLGNWPMGGYQEEIKSELSRSNYFKQISLKGKPFLMFFFLSILDCWRAAWSKVERLKVLKPILDLPVG